MRQSTNRPIAAFGHPTSALCGRHTADRLAPVGLVAVLRITIHVLEIVAVVIVVLLYLLIKVWRRI